jgi:hypothetical protein
VAAGVELSWRASVEIRDVQGVRTVPIRGEDQVTAIRRPARILVAASAHGELGAAPVRTADIDVEA